MLRHTRCGELTHGELICAHCREPLPHGEVHAELRNGLTPDLDVRERFKPLYYAFLYFTDDPNYQKLPPELSEPVKDIIKQTEQLAADYT